MIIFLYGEDTFRSRQKLKELKNKFIHDIDPNGSSLTVLDGKNIDIKQINDSVGTRSLLAKKRMVIIEDIFLNKTKIIFEDVLRYFKKTREDKDDNIIIFWDSGIKSKKINNKKNILLINSSGKEKTLTGEPLKLFNFLSKQKLIQEFNLLSNPETVIWIKKQFGARKVIITNQAIQVLISLIGNDLWQINNEVNKLINYKLGLEPKLISSEQRTKPTTIEIEDIKKLVKGNFDESIFALTDAISNKNKILIAKLLEEHYEAGLTDSYLINMIIRQFKILLQIRQSLDSGLTTRKIMSTLKLHPFIIQKGINQVRNFSLIDLKNILNKLIEIDYLMKTGQAEAKIMLNLFAFKI